MRKSVMLIAGLAALMLFAGGVEAKIIQVKVTQQQVKDVCGKHLQTGGGHSGCGVNCAGGNLCSFDAAKQGAQAPASLAEGLTPRPEARTTPCTSSTKS